MNSLEMQSPNPRLTAESEWHAKCPSAVAHYFSSPQRIRLVHPNSSLCHEPVGAATPMQDAMGPLQTHAGNDTRSTCGCATARSSEAAHSPVRYMPSQPAIDPVPQMARLDT